MAAAVNEPALYRLLTLYFRFLGPTKVLVQVRGFCVIIS